MGFEFTLNEWLVVGLVFLLGLVLGGALFSGGGRKYKERYNDEVRRRQEAERESEALRRGDREVSNARVAAAREEGRREEARRDADRPIERP